METLSVSAWTKVEGDPESWNEGERETGGEKSADETLGETTETESTLLVLNAVLLEPPAKYPTIFRHFDALAGGAAFEILEDHDPKPLYYQLLAIRGNVFTWEYRESGPETWRVQITKKDVDNAETVAEIAARDLRKAEVLKRFGIDFYCCGGKRTLKQACEENGLDFSVVETALENAHQTEKAAEHFNRWSLDFLADYIYNKHHVYFYDENPVIADLLNKAIIRHGEHYSVLQRVFDLYRELVQELTNHFAEEEKVLFPYVKALVQAKNNGEVESLRIRLSLEEPVRMMEHDHEAAGEILLRLRETTENYAAPDGACEAFCCLYRKLQELDEDLRQHIHLENNILFPKAIALEKSLFS